MGGLGSGAGVEYHAGLYLTPRLVVALAIGALASCPIVPWWHRRRATVVSRALQTSHALATVAAVAALLLASMATLAAGTHQPFLYFRF